MTAETQTQTETETFTLAAPVCEILVDDEHQELRVRCTGTAWAVLTARADLPDTPAPPSTPPDVPGERIAGGAEGPARLAGGAARRRRAGA